MFKRGSQDKSPILNGPTEPAKTIILSTINVENSVLFLKPRTEDQPEVKTLTPAQMEDVQTVSRKQRKLQQAKAGDTRYNLDGEYESAQHRFEDSLENLERKLGPVIFNIGTHFETMQKGEYEFAKPIAIVSKTETGAPAVIQSMVEKQNAILGTYTEIMLGTGAGPFHIQGNLKSVSKTINTFITDDSAVELDLSTPWDDIVTKHANDLEQKRAILTETAKTNPDIIPPKPEWKITKVLKGWFSTASTKNPKGQNAPAAKAKSTKTPQNPAV